MWRARFGRGFGPVVRQTTKLNEDGTLMPKHIGDAPLIFILIKRKTTHLVGLINDVL
jgi:hypothetical protein